MKIKAWKYLNISRTIVIDDGKLRLISSEEKELFLSGERYWWMHI